PETFAKQLTAWGADAVGVNCSVGPAGVLEAVEKLVKATDRPISAVPNAGLPKDVGDRKIYLASPEYMASYARRMIEAGARIVGGRAEWPRRAAGPEPHGRAPLRDPDPKGSGYRDRHPLLLSGPQPARDAVGHPRRARRRVAQHPDHHRRSAQDGPLPRGHRGLRHRLDRPHEPGISPESRARPGQQPDRDADPMGHRRRREPRRRGPGPRAVALRLEGGC